MLNLNLTHLMDDAKCYEALRQITIDSKGFGVAAPLRKKNRRFSSMIARSGEVMIRMLENVQQQTIEPLLKTTIAAGSVIYTDEYGIYNALTVEVVRLMQSIWQAIAILIICLLSLLDFKKVPDESTTSLF